jgi:hypothetical protein
MNNPRLAHLTGLKPKPRPAALYGLHNGDNQLRWIGTALDPQARARQHWSDARLGYARGNPELSAWLLSLPARPAARVLAWLEPGERYATEARVTAALLGAGVPLLNKHAGQWAPCDGCAQVCACWPKCTMR